MVPFFARRKPMSQRPRSHCRPQLEVLEDRVLFAAALVANINQNAGASSNPAELTVLGNNLIFTADDGQTGRELWKTDAAGNTTQLKNINDVGAGQAGSNPFGLTVFSNHVYFFADNGVNGYELWRTDGTAGGTELVTNINSDAGGIKSSVDPLTWQGFTEMNGKLYFAATSAGDTNYELWTTYILLGNPVTERVKDIYAGAENGSNPQNFVAVGNTLYFHAADAENGRELWKTDGTANGTVIAADIRTGAQSSVGLLPDGANMVESNGNLYFRANDGQGQGAELWKYNLNAQQASLVADINPGADSSFIQKLTPIAGGVIFSAIGSTVQGREPWISYGTAETTKIENINGNDNQGSDPTGFTVAGNGNILFNAAGGLYIHEPNLQQATTTIQVPAPGNASSFTRVGNTIYFSGYDNTRGHEIWRSDGTVAGTVFVDEARPGSTGSLPAGFVAFNNSLYFAANGVNAQQQVVGRELFKINLTPPNVRGRVWNDANADGIQTAGEQGIPDIEVGLYDSADDSLVGSTTTDVEGNYAFLTPGPASYYVKFVPSAGQAFAPQNSEADDTVNSDAEPSGVYQGRTAVFTLLDIGNDVTFDAGLIEINQSPAGADNSITTDEDTSYIFTAADFNFSDPNDDPSNSLAAVQIVNEPSAGSLTNNGAAVSAGMFISVADINAGNLVFTPAANAHGTGYASFEFKVQDDGGTDHGGSDIDQTARTMTIDVTGVNDAPTANHDEFTIHHGTELYVVESPILTSNDSDPDGDALTAELVSGPTSGTLEYWNAWGEGTFLYTPVAGFVGEVTFTYRVFDGIEYSNTATVTIHVTNAPPVTDHDEFTMHHSTELYVVSSPILTSNDSDPDGDALIGELVSGPTSGTLEYWDAWGPGTFLYTPVVGFVGEVTFSYRLFDGAEYSNTSTVTIYVTNEAPVAGHDEFTMHQGTELYAVSPPILLSNDSDPDGDALTAELLTGPTSGTLEYWDGWEQSQTMPERHAEYASAA